MRTIRTKVYKFNELSKEAKQKAIEDYRSEGIDVSHIYDEAHDTVKAFHNAFGTSEGSRSWLNVRFDNFNDEVLELTGLRLRTYIINNFWNDLYKPKYFGIYRNGKSKTRLSKIQLESDCPLTGVCYDHSLLQPIYDFLKFTGSIYNVNQDFKSLVQECFQSLEKTLQDEEDYMNTDEAISETLEANEYEYTKTGKQFY